MLRIAVSYWENSMLQARVTTSKPGGDGEAFLVDIVLFKITHCVPIT